MDAKRPPKIKVPMGTSARLTLAFLPLLAISLLFSFCSGNRDRAPGLNADDMAKIIAPEARRVEKVDNKAGRLLRLNHNGVLLETGFGSDWDVAVDGRQQILTSPDNSTICQSLVIPRREFDDMASGPGNPGRAIEALVLAGLQPGLPAGATASVSSKELFREGSSTALREGYQVDIIVKGQGIAFHSALVTVWMANDRSAASLSCHNIAGGADVSPLLGFLDLYRFSEEAP